MNRFDNWRMNFDFCERDNYVRNQSCLTILSSSFLFSKYSRINRQLLWHLTRIFWISGILLEAVNKQTPRGRVQLRSNLFNLMSISFRYHNRTIERQPTCLLLLKEYNKSWIYLLRYHRSCLVYYKFKSGHFCGELFPKMTTL